MPRFASSCIRALLAAVSLAGTAHALDHVTLSTGQTLDGAFRGFQNGNLEFQVGSEKPQRLSLARVKALTLTPPAEVEIRRRGGKRQENVRLAAYEPPAFALLTETGTQRVPAMQIIAIKPTLDMTRDMQLVEEAERATAMTGAAAAGELPLATGFVTVVQFHMADIASSVRQGRYVNSRCAAEPKTYRYQRIDLTGWDDPVATRHGIRSAPQFWFYDRQGNLKQKLTERFTEQDLDAALKAARK